MRKGKSKGTGNATEKLSEALADWFWGHRTADMVPDSAVKMRVKEVRAELPKEVQKGLRTLSVWNRVVSDVRVALEQKHPGVTLIRLRGLGWKLSTDAEYADFTMGWAKRTFNAAARTMDLAPHMKAQCIGAAVKKVFGENEGELKRLAKARHEFALTVQGWKKEVKDNGKKAIEE